MSNLGRSLSLNTGTSSLFGNIATTQPPASGLFGSSTSQSAQPGGLFGSTPASQPAQSGGLFGGAAAAPATSAQSGGLFKLGAPPAASSQPAASTGGGLFGASTTTSQPATGGLFGAAPATSKPGGLFGGSTMASAAPTTGGLFGGAAPASSAPTTGGLFGNTASAPQPAATGGLFGSAAPAASKPGGLFGNTTATSQPAAGGLFGASATAQPAATGGLFGAKPAAPSGGLFGASQPAAQPPAGGGLFGPLNNSTLNTSTTNASQTTIQAVKVDWSNVKPTTRFSELHDEVQTTILFLDEIITGAIRASMQVTETLPTLDKSVQAIGPDVEYLERRLDVVEGALGRDAVDIASAKDIVMKGEEDAVTMFRAVENLKLPGGFQYAQLGGSVDPTSTTTTDLLAFFGKRAEELSRQAGQFEKNQREVDQHLRMVEASAVDRMRRLGQRKVGTSKDERTGEGLREIAGVMRTFEEAILRVAERVGEGREAVVELEMGGAR